jgi:hypothetical protein
MNINQFYAECAALLGTTDECQAFPHLYRTRWNNRAPGRGRFPRHGLIRAFGDIVHIQLHHPRVISEVFDSREAAIEYLRKHLT